MSNTDDKEFVILDKQGNVIDSVDPYISHTIDRGDFLVDNGLFVYRMRIPLGCGHEIRDMWVRA